LTVDTTIPKLKKLKCDILYVTRDDIILKAGVTTFTFMAVQGLVREYKFKLTDIDSKGRLYLSADNLSQDHYYMNICGIDWELTENVYLLDVLGKYFHIDYDEDENTYIQLIPGYVNYLSGRSGDIIINTLESLGGKGVVTTNTITGFDGDIYDGNGAKIEGDIIFTHDRPTFSGLDKENEQDALVQSRKSLRTMYTLVSLLDWQDYLEGLPNIKRALAVDISYPTEIVGNLEPYFVRAFVVGDGGLPISDEYLQEISDEISKQDMIIRGTTFEILNGLVYLAAGAITVHLRNGSVPSAVVESNIRDKWEEFFNMEDRKAGEDFKFSKLASYLTKAHDSILYVESGMKNTETGLWEQEIQDKDLAYNEFAIGGDVYIYFVIG
jgi:hypothetical protein